MLDDRLWLIVRTVIIFIIPSWIVMFTEECYR